MNKVRTILSAFLFLTFAVPAFAYLDPGSGSLIFQLIVGGVAGLILAVKIFWRRILSFFRLKKNDA